VCKNTANYSEQFLEYLNPNCVPLEPPNINILSIHYINSFPEANTNYLQVIQMPSNSYMQLMQS